MKTIKFRPVVVLLLLFTAAATLSAQEKVEEVEIKKQKIQEVQERKKMLEEQQEQMKFMQKEFVEKQKEFAEQQRELEARAREAARESMRHSGVYYSHGDGDFVFVSPEQRNQSQLTLRKTFTGTSDTSSGEFDVEEGVRQFRCVINGNVRAGEITIRLEYPDGKTFKDLTINSSADISFSQSMSFREEEASRYTGTWKYKIEADKAEGNYMLQIMTN